MSAEPLRLRSVEPEITPEPSADERAAILRALRELRRERPESHWWRAGLDENGHEHDPAGPDPRDGAPPGRDDARQSPSSNDWSTSQGAKPWRR